MNDSEKKVLRDERGTNAKPRAKAEELLSGFTAEELQEIAAIVKCRANESTFLANHLVSSDHKAQARQLYDLASRLRALAEKVKS